MSHKTRKAAIAVASVATIATLFLSGCTPTDNGGTTDGITDAEREEALNTPTELTFWTWVPNIENQVALFEEQYPAIDVTVENVGQGQDQYSKIRAAIASGSGAPDVVQLEYQMISSFNVTDDLLDLGPYGATELSDEYVPWVWNQVSTGDAVWAIPQDSGPMGNLYREDILAQAGVTEPPATWADYRTAAEAVRANTSSYISNVTPGQASQWLAFLWQAGAKPFGYDGDKTVTINVNSDRAKEVVTYWEGMIKDDLVSIDPDFTDEWYQGLNQGKYAGWLTAAWAPVFLSGAAADTSGLWRAAPLPQWEEGDNVSGNWGGSSNAVLQSSENPIAAYELAKWINNAEEPTLKFATEQFLFPTTTALLSNPEFTEQEPEFYGGQKVNSLFAEISDTVDTDFQWLPFMDFAYSSFADTFGAEAAAKGDFAAGLDAWQEALVAYAEQQGFTVQQ